MMIRDKRAAAFILLILSLAALLGAARKTETERVRDALFKNLALEVNGYGQAAMVRCFYDLYHSSDCWYFFLPSGCNPESSRIHFSNCDHIRFEDIDQNRSYFKDGDHFTGLEMGRIYYIDFCDASDGSLLRGKFGYLRSEGLPAVFLRTLSGSMEYLNEDKDHEEKGQLMVMDENGLSDYSGAVESVKGRGNTSWRLEKKPYRLRLSDYAGLLGMNVGKTWVLLANALDKTLQRNMYAQELASRMGMRGCVDSRFVDVYFNGEYAGLYQLSEKIKTGTGELDIRDLEEKNRRSNIMPLEKYEHGYADETVRGPGERIGFVFDRDPEDISGGYVIERNYSDRYGGSLSRFRTAEGEKYDIREPEHASLSEVCYIADLMQSIHDRAARGEDISDLADLKSFADKYLFEEFVMNEASGSTSSFFYKDADGEDPLLYAGPPWDFDKTLGNAGSPMLDNVRYLSLLTCHREQTLLYYNLLVKNELFRSLVEEEYKNTLRPALISMLEEDEAGRYEQAVLSDNGMDGLRWRSNNEEIEEETRIYKNVLKERLDFFDDIWLGGGTVRIVHFEGDGEERNAFIGILDGETVSSLPALPDGSTGWYDRESGEQIKEGMVIDRDIEAVAK